MRGEELTLAAANAWDGGRYDAGTYWKDARLRDS